MDLLPKVGSEIRASVSLVRQGSHRFYTFSIDSRILAACCYATTRDEDPTVGFQRVLDVKRARDIAHYIDNEMGTIPSSIVLSAQPVAKFKSVDRAKTASFIFDPHSFLIIDGQHRLFGYKLSTTSIRVPVVVYDNLTQDQEARLFIDINTKQRPVPKELLLAIKSLAKTNNDVEAFLAEIFDLFDKDQRSALLGLTSSTKAAKGKISRVTFNAGLKPHLGAFSGKSSNETYEIFNAFAHAVIAGLRRKKIEKAITTKTTFRAFCEVFPDCAQRVADRFKRVYSAENFSEVLKPVFEIPSATLVAPRTNHFGLGEEFKKRLKAQLVL